MKTRIYIPVICYKGSFISVFLEGHLANVRVTSDVQYCSKGNFYDVEILEYPATKVIK